MLERLQAYQQEHNGSCNVPQRYRSDSQLGRWVMTQRNNHKKGLLAKERCDKLEAIGFQWTVQPKNYSHDPQLGNWVDKQRSRYKQSLLAKERYDQLEAI